MVGELNEILEKNSGEFQSGKGKRRSIIEEILEDEEENDVDISTEEVTAMLEKLPSQPLSQGFDDFFSQDAKCEEPQDVFLSQEEPLLSLTQEFEDNVVKISPSIESSSFDESFKACLDFVTSHEPEKENLDPLFDDIGLEESVLENNKRKREDDSGIDSPFKKRLILFNFKSCNLEVESPMKIISKSENFIKLELCEKLAVDISLKKGKAGVSYEILKTSSKDPYHEALAELFAHPLKTVPDLETNIDLKIFLQQLQTHAKWVHNFQVKELQFLVSSPLCHIPIVVKPASLHLSEVWKSKAEIYNHLGDVVFLVIVADSSRKKVDSTAIALMVGLSNESAGINIECSDVFHGCGVISKEIVEAKIQAEKSLSRLISKLHECFPKPERLEQEVAKEFSALRTLLNSCS